MTYPKVSTDRRAHRHRAASRRAPRFPADRGARCSPTGRPTAPSRPSVEQRDAGEDGANEFVFYDGPPFANGLPHYGHLLTGYVKDVVPRYQTMRGRRVERRFGWDTHGLPAELEAMSQLGIKTKDEILELGIEKFNDACRESVLKYTDEWRDYVTRQARWVDFDNDYKTLEPDYMESVIWAFKQLYDKGLVYEGFRVLPYCWNDETPLSNHELRMDDDVYQNAPGPGGHGRAAGCETGELRRWSGRRRRGPCRPTSRSWSARTSTTSSSSPTSPARTERYLLAEARLAAYARELGDDAADRVVERLKGSDLRRAARYTPPFAYYAGPRERATASSPPTSSPPRTAPGSCTRAGAFGEEDKDVTDARGHRAGRAGRPGRAVHRPGRRLRGHARLRRQPARSSTTSRRRPAARARPARSRRAPCCCAARPTTTPTRTAGAAASR